MRRGFAAAADVLHVTPAAVSMQIRTLEDYLRVPLFRRGGRAITLTAEGALSTPGFFGLEATRWSRAKFVAASATEITLCEF
jgi:Bacterial regulatory helix-turn-helix protein, lysR family